VTLSRQRRVERRAAERASARQQLLDKFGPAADERTTPDRRTQRTPQETERILRELGHEDRRRGDRRRR
jgi:hypothetical protein